MSEHIEKVKKKSIIFSKTNFKTQTLASFIKANVGRANVGTQSSLQVLEIFQEIFFESMKVLENFQEI